MKNIKRFIKDIYDAVTDYNRELNERVFIIMTIVSVVAAVIALFFDIITNEDYREIIILIATVFVVPIMTFTCMYKNLIPLASKIIVLVLVFVILPSLFYFGGGVEGGGVYWIIFAYIYCGMVLTGLWRSVIIVCITLLTVAIYLFQYYYPERIIEHSYRMNLIDSLVSIIVVGVVCFVMTWFQNKVFKDENERAKKEAERAEELTRAQNRFFSSMSHEIRTPINSILGLNELILRDQSTSDEIVKDAAGIQGAGKMLLSLINDILDFSKIEAGSMDIVPVDYKMADLISEIVNMIWLRAHDKGLRFDVNIDPNVPATLYGDEVRIKQIMINLLNNAIKYTDEGVIELNVECDEIDDDNVMLNISVSDTGMGIKKEVIPYLFDAFKRVDQEKNRRIEGTGLGLSIVKQLTELMGGTINVNSVYGEGSLFTAMIKQGVTDRTAIGELNIHNQTSAERNVYKASFKAPDARVLIVDDNEMNLEVEYRLLIDTDLTIDKALSGKEALDMTVKHRYDAILMDHLMPEMDGIECLRAIRTQSGGLNRATPVIVLTANAGSANRELYNRSGFDDYLVKPVAGDALEAVLVKHISSDKLILSDKLLNMREDINASAGYSSKVPVMVTTSSVSDIPNSTIRKLRLRIIPAVIRTEEGVFKDGVQMDAYELIKYIETGRDAISSCADEAAYTEFFADSIKRAHHLIHIALTSSMSDDYKMASEASKSFDNVTVINSGCLSSAAGILTLIAYKLAQQNLPVQDIVAELERIKPRLRCSFVVDTTEYMAKKGFVSPFINGAAKSIGLHPCISFRDDRSIVGPVWIGRTKRAYKKYINQAFPVDIIPDPDVVFVTYVDVPMDTLLWIKEEISKHAYFEHVVFKQASAAISSNCGPGTFGILYFVKSNKSYNIGSYIVNDYEDSDKDDDEDSWNDFISPTDIEEIEEPSDKTDDLRAIEGYESDDAAYENIRGIDYNTALTNSGSLKIFKGVLMIFNDSIPEKSNELAELYNKQDWENYTIKVHALKSSAKIIGAVKLAEDAQLLENAGKSGDVEYIRTHHDNLMSEYLKYRDYLSDVIKSEDSLTDKQSDNRPVADEYLLNSMYDGLKEAADNMDCDTIEDIIGELKDYRITGDDKNLFDEIRVKADNLDYDGILELLNNR